MPDLDPAIQAALEAEALVFERINAKKGFIMEAGAGAGKTSSLRKTLKYVLDGQSHSLRRANQRVACITYTETATQELNKDIDNDPAVFVSTIHSFCWSMIKDFQLNLKELILEIPQWNTKITEITDEDFVVDCVTYDQGFRTIRKNIVHLHHDDVPLLMAKLLESEKFCSIFIARFPILFIDEYQDTDKVLMDSILRNMVNAEKPLLLGLFGDHWQRIYDNVYGEVINDKLLLIKKHANFRSSEVIVNSLNKMRPGLEQFAYVTESVVNGEIKIYHTNSWSGVRGTGPHHGGSLPDDEARKYFNATKAELGALGWDFSTEKTKILLLTNSMLAKEQGYEKLLDNFPFPYTDQLLRKEEDHIKFFIDALEPVYEAYEKKRYGEMLTLLGSRANIKNHQDKLQWAEDMAGLVVNRDRGTIGDVIDYLYRVKRPRLPERVIKKHEELLAFNEDGENDEELLKRIEKLKKLRAIAYSEVKSFAKYVEGYTPFSTKHKVKGAEFENVLIVFSQGWQKYNFDKMLSMDYWDNEDDSIDPRQKVFFENNRNLFYVVCSRPRKRLALLFTHTLSDQSLDRLKNWYGEESISEPSVAGS